MPDDALALAERVRNKQVSALELVDQAIAAIERLNPQLNAVITPMFEQAREAAQQPLGDGPFAGVPFLLKDIRAAWAGVPTSAGSASLRNYTPNYNSELVERYKNVGLIVLGKTNTPEFGLTATTEPHAFGAAHNPWDLNRTPGGSSGGSAAAVAARIVPMAHSSDGGGSIRIPAACCGLVGLKPTRGRITMAPDSGDVMGGFVVEHAVTVSVRDSAALLDATAGPAVGDPYAALPPERPWLEEFGAHPGRLRIGFSTAAPTGTPVHSDCVEALRRTARLLEDLGHDVEEAAPDYDDGAFRSAFTKIWHANLAATISRLPGAMGRELEDPDLEPLTWKIFHRAKDTPATEYIKAVLVIQKVSRDIARFFTKHDLLLTPTNAEPPPVLGTIHPGPDDTGSSRPFLERVKEFVPFTQPANATGQPAISLPLEWSAEGLPIGIHFTARYGDEATLFRIAAQLEQAKPWADRLPLVV